MNSLSDWNFSYWKTENEKKLFKQLSDSYSFQTNFYLQAKKNTTHNWTSIIARYAGWFSAKYAVVCVFIKTWTKWKKIEREKMNAQEQEQKHWP